MAKSKKRKTTKKGKRKYDGSGKGKGDNRGRGGCNPIKKTKRGRSRRKS